MWMIGERQCAGVHRRARSAAGLVAAGHVLGANSGGADRRHDTRASMAIDRAAAAGVTIPPVGSRDLRPAALCHLASHINRDGG